MSATANNLMLHGRSRRAFTLVELMLSVALVLLLVIGVSQVFRISAEATGAGQALSRITRDHRAAQATLADDFRRFASDGPFLVISCRQAFAFQSREDRARDNRAASPGSSKEMYPERQDLNGDGVPGDPNVPGEVIEAAQTNSRSHRVDLLLFFARGPIARQTGDDGSYGSPTMSNEAMVWYGHARLPDGAGGFRNPGFINWKLDADRHPNSYAEAWILGRTALLLKDAAQIGGERHLVRTPGSTLSPLAWGSTSADGWSIDQSRYDLAGTTMAQVAADIQAMELSGLAWWEGLVNEPGRRSNDHRFLVNPEPPG